MQQPSQESPNSGRFEFQNWSIYKEAILFVREADELCSHLPKERTKSISDQLRRASQSIPLNIAEGSSPYTKPDKINFLRIARGSVFECVAILDVLGVLPVSIGSDLNKILERLSVLGKMLSGFIRFLETDKPEKKTTRAPTPQNP